MFQLMIAAQKLHSIITTIESDDALPGEEKDVHLDSLYRDLAVLQSRIREMKRAA